MLLSDNCQNTDSEAIPVVSTITSSKWHPTLQIKRSQPPLRNIAAAPHTSVNSLNHLHHSETKGRNPLEAQRLEVESVGTMGDLPSVAVAPTL